MSYPVAKVRSSVGRWRSAAQAGGEGVGGAAAARGRRGAGGRTSVPGAGDAAESACADDAPATCNGTKRH